MRAFVTRAFINFLSLAFRIPNPESQISKIFHIFDFVILECECREIFLLPIADRHLDDSIRSTFETIRQYDRNNPGPGLLLTFFRDGTFSGIVNMPYKQEPLEAERIASLIESLGNSHPLFALVAPLRAAIAAVNTELTSTRNASRT